MQYLAHTYYKMGRGIKTINLEDFKRGARQEEAPGPLSSKKFKKASINLSNEFYEYLMTE